MYQQYIHYCAQGLIEPKKRSSFGKIVRQAFPTVKKRRLGPAGEQTSHYVGIVAKRIPLPAPPPTEPLKVEPAPASITPQETAEPTSSDATFACDHRRLSIDWTQSFPSYAFFYANLLTREEEDCCVTGVSN